MLHHVKDGARTLSFRGEKLAESSSRRHESIRWIEFTLYKTESGSFILSRVGVSRVFHSSVCPLVDKYGLHHDDLTNLGPGAIPCEQCRPTAYDPIVYPEKHRFWTLVSEEAEAVLDALYKHDESGSRYLTKVAERLLDKASEKDAEIDQAYRFEFIE